MTNEMTNEMTDEEFLRYVAIHSRTEQALFSGKHIVRLFNLAGRTPSEVPPESFHALRANVADLLIEEARSRTQKLKEFKPGLYEHYKGGKYRALHLVKHHETEELYVVYVSLTYGSIYLREWQMPTADSWTDIMPDGTPRFRFIGP